LNGKLVAARAETAERRAKFEQAQLLQARGGNLQAIPDVVRSTVISQLRSQQAEVARKEADLAARYSESYPLVVNARAERRNIEASIRNEVGRIISNLKNDFDVAKAREDSLQASLIQLTGATGMDNDVGVRLRELERANVANKTLFENFLSRSKITQEQSALEERESRVISPATKPSLAAFPKKPLIGSVALIVGLMLGVGAAVALEMLNAGFTTPRQVEEKLGRAVLAAVPLLKDKDRKVGGELLDPARYLAAKPLSRYAEALRAIRMGVQMADVDNPPKVILLTSSIPQEGKSTLAISLAFSAAKAGQKVLLVDGDLRHPTVTKFFGLETQPGLVDLLAATAAADQCFLSADGISVLGAGSKSQNPPDLLGSERMRGLIENMRTIFDYIIIDSPPVGPVIDGKVLAQLADKILFVVRWQSTTREVVGQNIENFVDNRKVAGIVLNHVDESKTPKYGPYSHYSGYYYQKYYQN
jgi:succinoglycan biosynthesis transport protein ExoP